MTKKNLFLLMRSCKLFKMRKIECSWRLFAIRRSAVFLIVSACLPLLVPCLAEAETVRVHLWFSDEGAPEIYQNEAEALGEVFDEAFVEKASTVQKETVSAFDEGSVLWVVAPGVEEEIQEVVFDWVRAGGRLVLAPGAMSMDRDGETTGVVASAMEPSLSEWRPLTDVDGLFGVRVEVSWYADPDPEAPLWEMPEPAATGMVAGPGLAVEGGAEDVDPSGQARNVAVAEYADGRPAAVEFEIGAGKVRLLGFFPGSAEITEEIARLAVEF